MKCEAVMELNIQPDSLVLIVNAELPPFVSARSGDVSGVVEEFDQGHSAPYPLQLGKNCKGFGVFDSIGVGRSCRLKSAGQNGVYGLTHPIGALKVRMMMPSVRLSVLGDGDGDYFGVFLSCMLLLIVVIAGAYAVMWLRKRMWGSEEAETPSMGFTLGDLRQLHKAGKLSDEEFQRAKDKIVVAAQRAAERDSRKPPRQSPPNSGVGGR